MSHQPSHSTEILPPPAEQSDEGIHFGKVIGVGVASLVIFFVASLITLRLMRAEEKELQPLGPLPLPRQVGKVEIGIVDQVPFDVTRALQAYRQEKLGLLESWGWADQKRGLVHMPIDRAMEDVIAGQKGEKK